LNGRNWRNIGLARSRGVLKIVKNTHSTRLCLPRFYELFHIFTPKDHPKIPLLLHFSSCSSSFSSLLHHFSIIPFTIELVWKLRTGSTLAGCESRFPAVQLTRLLTFFHLSSFLYITLHSFLDITHFLLRCRLRHLNRSRMVVTFPSFCFIFFLVLHFLIYLYIVLRKTSPPFSSFLLDAKRRVSTSE
jgi:hypothetical protein